MKGHEAAQILKSPFKRFCCNFSKYKSLVFMMLPLTIIIFVNSYLPMPGLIMAFKNVNYYDGIFKSPNVGMANFEFLFNSGDALKITLNTLYYSIIFIVLNLTVAIIMALGLNELRGKYKRKIYQTLFIMPYFLSMIVISYLVYAFLSPDKGFINQTILKFFNIESVNWYSTPNAWPIILPIVNMWKMVGYNSVIYLAALAGIDGTLYEAAVIDGASKWQQIRFITMPCIKTYIVVMILLSMGNIMHSDFGLFYQVPMNAGSLFSTTNVIDTYVYRALSTLNNVGMSTAAGLYQSLVGFILVISANLAVRKIDADSALF